MIDRIISLRNRVHKDDFRFVLTPKHWDVLYMPETVEKHNLATVVNDGELKGYAAYYLTNIEQARAYDVREICAADEKTFTQLIDQIVDKSKKDQVDFVLLRSGEDPYKEACIKKGFLSFKESVVLVALLDPEELLSNLSEKIENGKILKLVIKDFVPITIKVGQKGIEVVKEGRPDVIMSTDGKTFLRLFFGRTSLLRMILNGKVSLDNILNWTTAARFFSLVRHSKLHIPMGDWV